MTIIDLKHLRANVLVQYLAGLGIFRVISKKDPSATLHWAKNAGEYCPILETTLPKEEIPGILLDDFKAWKSSDLLSLKVKMKLPRTLVRALLLREGLPLRDKEFIASYTTEAYQESAAACALNEENQDPALDSKWCCLPHPLNVLGRNATFFIQTRKMLSEILEVENTRDALSKRIEEWLFEGKVEDHFTKDLWHVNAEDIWPANASGVLLVKDPICEWFGGFQSIPLFPAIYRRGRLETSCFEKDTWYSPIWDQPLTLPLVEFLLRMRYSTMKPSEQRLRGIVAVYSTLRIQRNKHNVYLASVPYVFDARKV